MPHPAVPTPTPAELVPHGTGPAPAAPTTPPVAQSAPADQAAPPAQETDWKAEARKWEQRAKENSSAAARLAQMEEDAKSAEQRQADRMAALVQENEVLRLAEQQRQWAAEVSAATCIPAGVLRGSTLEEIQAHAASIAPLVAPSPPPAQPVPTVGQTPQHSGNVPIGEQIAAATKAGNTVLVAALKAVQLGALNT